MISFLFKFFHTLFHYYSTACLHEEHGYCKNKTGMMGTKTPGLCKFCNAPCKCKCHRSR